jgi:hypothetical protein
VTRTLRAGPPDLIIESGPVRDGNRHFGKSARHAPSPQNPSKKVGRCEATNFSKCAQRALGGRKSRRFPARPGRPGPRSKNKIRTTSWYGGHQLALTGPLWPRDGTNKPDLLPFWCRFGSVLVSGDAARRQKPKRNQNETNAGGQYRPILNRFDLSFGSNRPATLISKRIPC